MSRFPIIQTSDLNFQKKFFLFINSFITRLSAGVVDKKAVLKCR